MKLHLPVRLFRAVVALMVAVPSALYAAYTAPSDIVIPELYTTEVLVDEWSDITSYAYSPEGVAFRLIEDMSIRESTLMTFGTGSRYFTSYIPAFKSLFISDDSHSFLVDDSHTLEFVALWSITLSELATPHTYIGSDGYIYTKGGAIYGENHSTIMLSNNGTVTFSGNSASGDFYTYGGAIYGGSRSSITLSNNGTVTFSGNSAFSLARSSRGGAIYGAMYSSITLSNNGTVTFSGNSASDDVGDSYSYGGAIYGYLSSTITLSNNDTVSFSRNRSASGGAIYGEGTITLSNNDTVTFSENTAFVGKSNKVTQHSQGGAIDGDQHSTITLSDNGTVTFSGNTASGYAYAYGGAIYGDVDSTITLSNNGSVTFSGNSASSLAGCYSFGGAICGHSSTITLSNNDTVTFSGNSASSSGTHNRGGAISGGNDSTITLSNNGTVTFRGNSVSGYHSIRGGAIFGGDRSTITLSNNGTVTFSGNSVSGTYSGYGGAIYGGGNSTITLSNNGEVSFTGNTASGSSYDSGGAIYTNGNLHIRNNDSVEFVGNVEKSDSGYRLRSIYVVGGSGDTVSLSAAAGKSITFRDSMYIRSSATVDFNADYTDTEGNTIAQKGDILFTGATAEADLLAVKGSAGTAEEILNSRTTEVLAMTNLYGGRLSVEDGAVYKGYGITAHEGSEATLRVKDATLNHAGYNITLNAGTTLELEGSNKILAANLAMQEGSNLHFVLGEGNTEASALTLEGTLRMNGAVNLSFDATPGVYKLISLSGSEVADWSLLTVSGMEGCNYSLNRDATGLTFELLWDLLEYAKSGAEMKLSGSRFGQIQIEKEFNYDTLSATDGCYSLVGSGSMGVSGLLSVTGGADVTLDVETSASSVEVGDGSSLSIRKGLNLLSLMTLAEEEGSTEAGKAISVGSHAELSLADATLLGQVSLADDSSEVYYQTQAGDKLLQFSGELGSAGLNLTVGEDGKTVNATDSAGFTGNITVLSGTTLVNAVAEEGYNTAFGDTYDVAPARQINVQGGAVLELNGRETYYHVALEEGACLSNNGGNIPNSWRSLPVVDLSGDAEVHAAAQISMVGNRLAATSLNLNGHTLTKSGASNFELRNTSVGGGTLAVNEGVVRMMNRTSTADDTCLTVNNGGTLWISEGTGSYAGKLKVNGGSVYLLEMPSSQGGDNITDAQALDLSGLSSLELAGGLLSFRGSHVTLGTVDVTADSTLQLWDQVGTGGVASTASTIGTLNADAALNLTTTWKSTLDINVLTGGGSLSVGSSREKHTVNVQNLSGYSGTFRVNGNNSTLSLNLDASDVLDSSRILLENDSRLILKGNGALNVAEGQILNAAGISVATDSGVLLKGSGTYRFGDMENVTGSATGMAGVDLSPDWTGRVLLENITTTGIELDDFGGAGKTIDINGVSGWFDYKRTVESHLRLGENGLTLLDTSQKTYTYTGGMSGSGDFTIKTKAHNSYTGTYDLSGNLAAWSGAFRVQQSAENGNTPDVNLNLTGGGTLFSGAEGSGIIMERLGTLNVTLGNAETATTMNGSILNTGVTDAEGTTTYGTLNLTANHTVSLNNTVQANTMTLGEGAAVSLNGATTLSTLTMGEGAKLSLGKTGILSVESINGALELSGEGTYDLGTAKSLTTGVTLGTDWTGSVRLTGATLAGDTLAGLSTEQSTVELCGVRGYLSRADSETGAQTYAANLKLTNNGSSAAWNLNNGYNGDVRIFSGDISGTGTLQRSSYKGTNQTLIFTGDTSGWTGTLQHSPDLASNSGALVTTDVTFSGTAELNVALLKNNKGKFNVTLDDEHLAPGSTVTVNKDIQSTTLTVTEGTTAMLKATASQDTTTLRATEGGTATLSGVKASATALEGLGEDAAVKGLRIDTTNEIYGINHVTLQGVHFSAALVTLTLTDVSFDTDCSFSVGAEGSILLSDATLRLTLPEAGNGGIYRVDLSHLFQCTVEGDLNFDVDTEALVAAGYTGVELDFGSDADEDYSNLTLSMAGATYKGTEGNVAGFTLPTIPEPSTATLSLLALAALASRRRRG